MSRRMYSPLTRFLYILKYEVSIRDSIVCDNYGDALQGPVLALIIVSAMIWYVLDPRPQRLPGSPQQ